MAKREPSILDEQGDADDEAAMRTGEADADAGRVVPHDEVTAWLKTWGAPGEKPVPKTWLK